MEYFSKKDVYEQITPNLWPKQVTDGHHVDFKLIFKCCNKFEWPTLAIQSVGSGIGPPGWVSELPWEATQESGSPDNKAVNTPGVTLTQGEEGGLSNYDRLPAPRW